MSDLSTDSLIDRIADGAFLRDLAIESGIDKRRLSERLRKHPDYGSAKESAIEVQLDDAQLALSLAIETTDIARAREMFRAAAWRAEHEFPERWGKRPDIAIQINNISGLEQALTGDAASLLDKLRTVAVQQQIPDVALHSPDSDDLAKS